MKKFLIIAAIIASSTTPAFAQGYIPTCPVGSHIVILNSEALSSLYGQAEHLDGVSADMRKKQQSAKTSSEAALNGQAADDADQAKSAVMSAYLDEQFRNMRCVVDR